MNAIHISTARLILNRPEPVDIRLWTAKGEIQEWQRCICIKYDHYKGIRKFKLLNSNRSVRPANVVSSGSTAWKSFSKPSDFSPNPLWNKNYFVPLHPERVATSRSLSYCSCLTCIRSTLYGNEADALLSCTLESGKFKSKQDGVRRFTYIRGLVVSWSFCTAFQSLSVETWDTQAHVPLFKR